HTTLVYLQKKVTGILTGLKLFPTAQPLAVPTVSPNALTKTKPVPSQVHVTLPTARMANSITKQARAASPVTTTLLVILFTEQPKLVTTPTKPPLPTIAARPGTEQTSPITIPTRLQAAPCVSNPTVVHGLDGATVCRIKNRNPGYKPTT